MKLRQYAEGNFLPIIQHEIVEVVVPAKSSLTRIQFPDIQNLRDSNLVAIEFYQGVWSTEEAGTPAPTSIGANNDNISEIVAVSPTGKYLCPQQVAKNSYLTLQAYNGVEFLHQSPLLTHRYVNISSAIIEKYGNYASENMIHQFSGQKCNWPKCYIERFDNYKGLIETEFSYLFSIYYYKSNEITTLMGAEFRKQS